MSETKPTAGQALDLAQISDVSGGECSADELRKAIGDMKQNYENLVDFASYVIERIAGGPSSGNP